MFDLIGDIHGHATELEVLLDRLGYAPRAGAWRHPSRTAIFLGDFVDRGPDIARTLSIVRSMVEGGAARAVLGNHEVNAIAYATERADRPGEFCRAHNERNRRQHEATLSQLSDPERTVALDWFRTLPLWLDLGGLRVVHACWDEKSRSIIERILHREGSLTEAAVREMHDQSSPAFDAMEILLKGPEIPLPEGVTLADAEGHPRKVIRARWFEPPRAWTYGALVFPPSPRVPDLEIPVEARAALSYYPSDAVPLFFGHYWMPASEEPSLLAPNVACLDWSVARGGHLAAYRWDGERVLEPGRLLWVPAREASERPDPARTMSP